MENRNIFEEEKLSLWLKDGISNSFKSMEADEICDVLIVGAGVAGITTAYMLSDSGKSVILIDKDIPLNLTTGNTTAKFTFQHGVNYNSIIENQGLENAKLYYDAQIEAMNFVENLVFDNNIPCDFKKTYAMVYAENESDFKEIMKEYHAYKKLNIPCELVEEVPYGLKGVGGLKVEDQIVLNPVKYCEFLLSQLSNKNIKVYEKTNVVDTINNGERIVITTDSGKRIQTNKLVVATGYPYYDAGGLFFTRLEASRSYLTAYANVDASEGMLISNSSSAHSIRFSNTDGINYLLIGGGAHKVGQEDSAMKSYEDLILFAKNNFNTSNLSYRWSAQDYESLDKIPYIGQITDHHKNVFVATGFKKWGMTNGTFAGLLISSLINNLDSKYTELFKPSRGEVKENIGTLLSVNLNVAKELIKGKIAKDEVELKDIHIDTGGIIKFKGKRTGAYRDQNGTLHLVDSTCTHLGCELEYNNAERTFDCPCHGSRFNYEGKVIEGPANKDLKIINEENNE